jgi:hypothetical protein
MGDVRSSGGPESHGLTVVATTTKTTTTTTATFTPAERTAGLRSQLLLRGAGAKISALLKEHGYVLSFKD